MSMRGRPPFADPPVEWKLHIPKSVADKITEELCKLRPGLRPGEPAYGARGELTIKLYRKWLQERTGQS